MCFIIYKTTNLLNGKIYVGQHYTSADDGYLGSGKILKSAINKYGKENFIRETLEYCNSDDIDKKEIFWISNLNTTNRDVGYNIAKGGHNHRVMDEDVKNKLSVKMLGKIIQIMAINGMINNVNI